MTGVRQLYKNALEHFREDKPRWEKWDTFQNPDDKWRLWDSVEMLDITDDYLKWLIQDAKRAKHQNIADKLHKVEKLVDSALCELDSTWKATKRFMDMTEDLNELENALNFIKEAFSLYDEKLYMSASIYVEYAKHRKQQSDGWILVTPMIWSHLRDASYGIQKYLDKNKAKTKSEADQHE